MLITEVCDKYENAFWVHLLCRLSLGQETMCMGFVDCFCLFVLFSGSPRFPVLILYLSFFKLSDKMSLSGAGELLQIEFVYLFKGKKKKQGTFYITN